MRKEEYVGCSTPRGWRNLKDLIDWRWRCASSDSVDSERKQKRLQTCVGGGTDMTDKFCRSRVLRRHPDAIHVHCWIVTVHVQSIRPSSYTVYVSTAAKSDRHSARSTHNNTTERRRRVRSSGVANDVRRWRTRHTCIVQTTVGREQVLAADRMRGAQLAIGFR